MLCDKYKPIFLDDYKIHLNLIGSERENRADISFTEPFFLDRNS